jgi:hypothetical protein
MERHAAEVAERLHEIEGELDEPEEGDRLCLRFGIEMNEWIAEWCERAARELDGKAVASGGRV